MLEKIKELFANFEANAAKDEAGNKAAGRRARKISLEIAKTLKDYRKESVERV